ncbi:hypothetical protein KKE78_01765 [Patescibacteria group bacterium]|nr:hypothetical protein [Patescibacteria group bacterium]
MGIEAIRSAAGSVVSAIGRGASFRRIFGEMPLTGVASVSGPSFLAPIFEAALIGGLLNSIGPKLEKPLAGIVNEGPVALADFKNTMPLQLRIGQKNPIAGINFQSQPMLKAPSVIAGAESVLAQARIPEPKEVFPVTWPQTEALVVPLVRPDPLEVPAADAQPQLQSQIEARVINQPVQVALPAINPVLQEREVEEPVEEKVKIEELKEALGEETVTEKRLYLEDQGVSAVRRQEIRQATIKAKVNRDRLGLKKITGWLVAKFLPGEHKGNRSQIVKETGPDGSYQETVEEIAGAGDFESERKAIEKFDKIVAEKKPVKLGENGKPVGNEDVARVLKYHVVKPALAYIEATRRVVKKRAVDSIKSAGVSSFHPKGGDRGWTEVGQEGIKEETSLKDYPVLAEVFSKAA